MSINPGPAKSSTLAPDDGGQRCASATVKGTPVARHRYRPLLAALAECLPARGREERKQRRRGHRARLREGTLRLCGPRTRLAFTAPPWVKPGL